MPLGDERLLEEHELTNVLNQLPEELAEEAFNELFTGESIFHISTTSNSYLMTFSRMLL